MIGAVRQFVGAKEDIGWGRLLRVINNLDPGKIADDRSAIGMHRKRPAMTGAIQNSNGSDTAYAIAAIAIPNRVGKV